MLFQDILSFEIQAASPFRITTLVIFILAIIHTLIAHHFTNRSQKMARYFAEKKDPRKRVSFLAEIFHFLGEIEIVFALWAIPLSIAVILFYGFDTLAEYLNSRVYTEPFFILVIMTLASTAPIVQLTETFMGKLAKCLGGGVQAWWLVILTVGPILGSLITEVAAMTIAAVLIQQKLYIYRPSKKLAYATLGLLFTNFSVGGILTNFATPPSLMLSRCWQWQIGDFFAFFGWKILVGIALVNTIYFFILKKEFTKLEKPIQKIEVAIPSVPVWLTCLHLFFLIGTLMMVHYPPIFLGGFLLFLGMHHITRVYQSPLKLRSPLLVALFLAGLVIHGGFQGWWIDPLIGGLDYGPLMIAGAALTAFNENTTVAYLACLLKNNTIQFQYALVSGLVVGGGLTIIAHAPNPVGQALLRKYFKGGISPWNLFLGAIFPTLVFLAIFYFFPI